MSEAQKQTPDPEQEQAEQTVSPETAAENTEESLPETASAPEKLEAVQFPQYYLITDDFILTCIGIGTETGDFPVELHAGDVVQLTKEMLEVNGESAVSAEQLSALGGRAMLLINARTAARIAENGTETDAAFYQKNTKDAEAAEVPAPEAEAQPAGEVSADAEPQPQPEKAEEVYTAKQLLEDALDLIESVLASVFVVMMIFTFVFCVATVEGDSMVPTLTSGDRLMVNRIYKHYDDGDILILNSTTAYVMDKDSGDFYSHDGLGKRIVKRLIAQAGEEINIDFNAGIVYVNGVALDEPYVNTLTTRNSGAFNYPLTVPEGYVFVMGDNRNISRDSRHPDVGLVPVDDIIGSVVLRLTPLSEFGKLD